MLSKNSYIIQFYINTSSISDQNTTQNKLLKLFLIKTTINEVFCSQKKKSETRFVETHVKSKISNRLIAWNQQPTSSVVFQNYYQWSHLLPFKRPQRLVLLRLMWTLWSAIGSLHKISNLPPLPSFKTTINEVICSPFDKTSETRFVETHVNSEFYGQ